MTKRKMPMGEGVGGRSDFDWGNSISLLFQYHVFAIWLVYAGRDELEKQTKTVAKSFAGCCDPGDPTRDAG